MDQRKQIWLPTERIRQWAKQLLHVGMLFMLTYESSDCLHLTHTQVAYHCRYLMHGCIYVMTRELTPKGMEPIIALSIACCSWRAACAVRHHKIKFTVIHYLCLFVGSFIDLDCTCNFIFVYHNISLHYWENPIQDDPHLANSHQQ